MLLEDYTEKGNNGYGMLAGGWDLGRLNYVIVVNVSLSNETIPSFFSLSVDSLPLFLTSSPTTSLQFLLFIVSSL